MEQFAYLAGRPREGFDSAMTRRKVLHIVGSLNFGGVESRMKILALNAGLSEFEHRFCAIARGGPVADELAAAGQPVTVLGVRSQIPSLSAIRALTRQIRAERPAVLHTRGSGANFHGLIAGRICRVPVCIAEEIGFPSHSRKARVVFRQVYRLADVVVAISHAVKQKLIELGELRSEDRAQVLHNPAQMLSERTAPAPSDVFEVGFVGRLESVKNPLALVQAAALLRDWGLALRVIIIGDGSQRQMLHDEVAKLNLNGIVELPGFDSRPFERLSGAALYVQPSISEGFGLALVEAMSAGIPVLATAVGGTPEIITDEQNGWLLAGTDPEAIAKGIAARAAMDPASLQAIGRAGRASVVERFSPAAYFSKCDAFYQDMLHRRHL